MAQEMKSENNNTWGDCPKCKSPVLINAATGQAEPCADCASKASPTGLYLGGFAVILGVLAFCTVVYLCIRLLIG